MARHLLDAKTVEKAKPKAGAYRLADGEGLFLFVAASGVKSWQFRYRLTGKPQTLTIGKWPVVSLADARKHADDARRRAGSGENLTQTKRLRKAQRSADASATFEAVAGKWAKREARRNEWTEDYVHEVHASLANHLSALNALPIAEITAKLAAPHLRKLEAAAPDMHSKVRQRLRSIMDFAVEEGLVGTNPIPAPRRRKRVSERKHLAAVVGREGVGEILRAAAKAEVGRGVRRAHQLLVFTAQRVGEVVGARWDEIDLRTGTWSIPRERMKRKDSERGPHVVPLPPRLLATLRAWRDEDGEGAIHVCPSRTGEPITREAVEKFYRRGLALSGRHSPHSWRTVFSTWSNDAGKEWDVIEAQLDHDVGGKVKVAYDRGKRLDRRAELMAWYEETVHAAREGAVVIALGRSRSSPIR